MSQLVLYTVLETVATDETPNYIQGLWLCSEAGHLSYLIENQGSKFTDASSVDVNTSGAVETSQQPKPYPQSQLAPPFSVGQGEVLWGNAAGALKYIMINMSRIEETLFAQSCVQIKG